MSIFLCVIFSVHFWLAAGYNISTRNNLSGFVTAQDESFQLDGRPFRFYGTNLYWAHMGTDDDINLTFHDIATAGLSVVRVWAFNDVAQKPSSGTYFQILADGQATINGGANGLERLDKVVATAGKFGLKLILTLSNNWNPERPQPSSSISRRNNDELPRGFLSNDYGGMDMYVRALHPGGTHDLFYTDPTIINAFKKYLSYVVPRYAQNTTVLGWELANDMRCSSTLPASSSCNTNTITKWTADIASYVKKLDPRHIITAGDGGFYCLSCKKLFAKGFTKPKAALTGSSFDGSFGVDTEDIMAIPFIDFGSFQLFPDQTQYFTTSNGNVAATKIGQGGAWIAAHSNTAIVLGKPEALTAVGIVAEDSFSNFVPVNETALMPAGSPCGGVARIQQDYARTFWFGASLSGNIGGFLEFMWVQQGLTSQGTTFMKRKLHLAPDGGGYKLYNGDQTQQNSDQTQQNNDQAAQNQSPVPSTSSSSSAATTTLTQSASSTSLASTISTTQSVSSTSLASTTSTTQSVSSTSLASTTLATQSVSSTTSAPTTPPTQFTSVSSPSTTT